jgi:DNA-binding protein
MSQLTLEFSNKEDLNLVLSVVKRLNIQIVSLKSTGDSQMSAQDRISILQKQSRDEQYIAETEEITSDFIHVDKEL